MTRGRPDDVLTDPLPRRFVQGGRARVLSACALIAAGAIGCGKPKLVGGEGAETVSGLPPGASPGTPRQPPTFDPGLGGAPPVAIDAAAPPGAGETCAEDVRKAERVPVDLLLTVDSSSSMSINVAGSTASKYALVKEALLSFVRDPSSAGLGLGIQFFPQPGSGSSCQINADCGYPILAPTPPPCQPLRACAPDPGASGPLRLCATRGGGCPGGAACIPLGRCSVSLLDCTAIGEACPGGPAGDRCLGLGSVCETTDEIGGCNVLVYEQLPVPIATLPIPGAHLVSRQLDMRGPSGSTPMRPAVEGALNHLRKHLAANPGHKGVFVLATDGVPSPGCTGNTIDGTAGVISAARTASAITTYVVGIATPNDAAERMALQTLATAGGSGQPFIIGPMDNLGQRFLETLNQIRGQSLPCDFAIPPPRAGGSIDYGKVNVHWKGVAAEEDVLYAGDAARCDPAQGGWHYDVDPATGNPTRIIACPATCQKFKSDPMAAVEIRFGCRTRVID
jgi:hypothetical protein